MRACSLFIEEGCQRGGSLQQRSPIWLIMETPSGLQILLAFLGTLSMTIPSYAATMDYVVGYAMGLGYGSAIRALTDGEDLYVYQPEAYEQYRNLLDLLSRLADRKGCTSAQLALLWARSQGFSTIVAGSRNEEQLKQLLCTSHLELDEEEKSLLDERAETLTSCAPSSWDNYFGHRW